MKRRMGMVMLGLGVALVGCSEEEPVEEPKEELVEDKVEKEDSVKKEDPVKKEDKEEEVTEKEDEEKTSEVKDEDVIETEPQVDEGYQLSKLDAEKLMYDYEKALGTLFSKADGTNTLVGFDSKEEVQDYLEDYLLEREAKEMTEDYFVEEEGVVKIIPKEGPKLFDEGTDYTLTKEGKHSFGLNQIISIQDMGSHELYYKFVNEEGKWKIGELNSTFID